MENNIIPNPLIKKRFHQAEKYSENSYIKIKIGLLLAI